MTLVYDSAGITILQGQTDLVPIEEASISTTGRRQSTGHIELQLMLHLESLKLHWALI